MGPGSVRLLRTSCLVGAITDALVGVNWLLISSGYDLSNVMNSYRGSGQDYCFAMYIASLLMFGWSAILLWGYFRPLVRRGLLLISALIALFSIAIELVFFGSAMVVEDFIMGILIRVVISGLFLFAYLYSLRE